MKVSLLNVFGTGNMPSGNPAVIVSGFTGSKLRKQKLAKEFDLPVTVFINNLNQAQPTVEFFYPLCEMPLCLHGAIAAGYQLLTERQLPHLTLQTSSGMPLPIIQNNQGVVQICISSQSCPKIKFTTALASELLNCTQDDFNNSLFFGIASVGSPKFLIPMQSLTKLQNLSPDFEAIKKWSIENHINGLYVYCAETINHQADFHARAFNPKGGNNEDIATGVAAAALSLALQKSIIIEQGFYLNSPSEIIVNYHSAEKIWVGGKVMSKKH